MIHRGLMLLALSALTAAPAGAVSVESWSASTIEEFELGTLDGTALDERGALRVAQQLETVWGPAAGIVWSLSPASGGGAFVGLSSPGRVIYLPVEGEPEVWFETGEDSLIASVAADGSGGVYFGLSPEGSVFHATGPAEVSEFAQTDAKFVWALAVSPDGSVWIGTGLPGHVKRVMPDGELLQVFDAEDDPVRSITTLRAGGVLVGTGGRGRVVRIDARGTPFVLLDADEAEIVSMVVDDDGVIFALAARSTKQVGSPPVTPAGAAVETIRVTANAPANGGNGGDDTKPRVAPRSFKMGGGAALYRIAPDGGTRRIWESPKDVPFMLTRGADGKLLVATGDAGRIYEVDDRGRASVRLTIGSDQASAIIEGAGGRILIGGTTDARVERSGPDLRRAGSYLSAPIDATSVADWGRVTWESEVPRGARVELYARAGNSSEPDGTWTEWRPLRTTGEGQGAGDLPATRWFQLRIDMQPSRRNETPLVRRLDLRYRVHNRRPAVKSLNVQPAGVVWTLTPVQSARLRGPLVANDPVARRLATTLAGASAATPPVRKSYELGARTLNWDASDPDGDRLTYSLEIRREGSESWIPMVRDLEQRQFSFDTRGTPDGFYRARLRASDERDNAAGTGLDDLESSTVFQIDNTRPGVARTAVDREGAGYRIEFVASDPGGNVAAVEVAVDGGEWRPVDPLDGVADSPEESYRMLIDEGEWGANPSRTLRVRVTDSAGNLGGDAWSLE